MPDSFQCDLPGNPDIKDETCKVSILVIESQGDIEGCSVT